MPRITPDPVTRWGRILPRRIRVVRSDDLKRPRGGGEAGNRGVWGAEPPSGGSGGQSPPAGGLGGGAPQLSEQNGTYVYRARESGVIRAREFGAIRENGTNHAGPSDTVGANSPASNSRFEVGGPQNLFLDGQNG